MRVTLRAFDNNVSQIEFREGEQWEKDYKQVKMLAHARVWACSRRCSWAFGTAQPRGMSGAAYEYLARSHYLISMAWLWLNESK